VYNPFTATWQDGGAMSQPRFFHTATRLADGRVLVAGGSQLFAAPLQSAEVFDPATTTWSSAGLMSTRRNGHIAALLPSGQVLVAGPDASADLYDAASNSWSPTASMNTARAAATASLLPDGSVLVAGGSSSTAPLGSAERYVSRYGFRGFFAPVSNPPAVNVVKAGSTVPVKWSLSGVSALSTLVAAQWTNVDCATLGGQSVPVDAMTTGATSLRYDPTSDQFIDNLATQPGWAGTCQQLTLRLDDGTAHTANFQFR
jgi:hypothetical protein